MRVKSKSSAKPWRAYRLRSTQVVVFRSGDLTEFCTGCVRLVFSFFHCCFALTLYRIELVFAWASGFRASGFGIMYLFDEVYKGVMRIFRCYRGSIGIFGVQGLGCPGFRSQGLRSSV